MTDEQRDDEMLGRALARAVESQDVNETPFERSRLPASPARRGVPVWQLVGAAALLVLAVALGSWFTRPLDQGPAAASPIATAGVSATPSPAASAAPASAPPRTQVDHAVVYFARDGLPPIASAQPGLASVFAGGHTSAEERITARIGVLQGATPPPGATNAFPGTPTNLISLRGGMPAVTIQGDTVTLDFNVPGSDWKVRRGAQSLALLQQLVYTATEEPGISRVLITENGGGPARIGDVAITKALSREDVLGYSITGPIGSISDGGAALAGGRSDGDQMQITSGTSVKLTVQGSGQGAAPAFVVYFQPTTGSVDLERMGKYVLTLIVGASTAPNSWTKGTLQVVDQTPVRARIDSTGPSLVVRQLILDDARPWRAYRSAGDVVVEVGGDPQTVSDRIAVSFPPPDSYVTRAGVFTIRGLARTFEGNVVWRLRDGTGGVVESGHATASIGTSSLWGTFSVVADPPMGITGNPVVLEVFEVSAKDGSELGMVRIPLRDFGR